MNSAFGFYRYSTKKMMNKTTSIIGAVLIGFFVMINIVTLKDGHNWGGDFSQYIIHARNIVEGKPYSSDIMVALPVVCSPGFPLLLAPMVKVFGVNFVALKFLNVIFWYAGIFFLFLIFKKRVGQGLAMLLSGLLACSSFYFVFKQNVLSDLPFFCFVCLTMWLVDRYSRKDKKEIISEAGIVLAMSACVLIRYSGIILFVSSIFYFLFIQKNKRLALGLFLGLLATLVVELSWIGYQPGPVSLFAKHPDVYLKLAVHNLGVVFQSCVWFFLPGQMPVTSVLSNSLQTVMTWVSGVLFGGIVLLFIIKARKKELSFYGCFAFVYFVALVVWAAETTPPENFARYLLPVVGYVPVFLFEQMSAWRKKDERVVKAVFVGLVFAFMVLNVFNISAVYGFDDDALFQKETQEMVAWVKNNTKPDDTLMFWRPRPLRLLTGRVCTAIWYPQYSNVHFLAQAQALKISYLIFRKSEGAQFVAESENNPALVRPVWKNDEYKIFGLVDDGVNNN
ncbi:MAG: glycosyltransferase family 39 protein [Candidatus Omnitrophica bacterium]|nr:glycosyltransferase family 39 protein [Candidatus Omnitrophota bacterium]